jgi:bacteriophage N4 adsorption protein B
VEIPSLGALWPICLGWLAGLLIVSGIDDLVPALFCLWMKLIGKSRGASAASEPSPRTNAQRSIAILVPCWKEADVIGSMVRHNLATIEYGNYEFFLGVYPNDLPTQNAALELAGAFSNVHVAVCPNPGPTSKADCLNAVFQRLVGFENERQERFDTLVLHDAEDVIHPKALAIINRERERYAMVQVPVLPLATPVSEFTHGVYCDDFSEFQTVDMRARQFMRAFIPSNGVGTGFAREIFDQLSAERGSEVFSPGSLTEDYEVGVYVHNAGFRQTFVPAERDRNGLIATREYFPRTVRLAIRQRTRWITGICLQSWERDGWRGSWLSKYWFWRDRKALLTNPLTLFTNALFFAGALEWFWSKISGAPWMFAVNSALVSRLIVVTTSLQVLRLGLRMIYTARFYGLRFALAVPLRVFHGNLINGCASVRALWQYSQAKRQKRPLVWSKTDHSYPQRGTFATTQRSFSDVLVAGGFIREQQVEAIRAELASDGYLSEVLRDRGLVSEEAWTRAKSLQSGLQFSAVNPDMVRAKTLRALPLHLVKHHRLIPFALESGRLKVAGSEAPTPEVCAQVSEFATLPVEFHLVTERTFFTLCERLRCEMTAEVR